MVDFIADLTYFSQGWAQYLLSIQLRLIIVVLNVQSVLPGVLYCVSSEPFFYKPLPIK